MEEEKLWITKKYLKELLAFQSNKIVGKVLKRLDILKISPSIKSLIKEVIHEDVRDVQYLIQAYNKGQELTVFNFKTDE